jgi:hypothetical protein
VSSSLASSWVWYSLGPHGSCQKYRILSPPVANLHKPLRWVISCTFTIVVPILFFVFRHVVASRLLYITRCPFRLVHGPRVAWLNVKWSPNLETPSRRSAFGRSQISYRDMRPTCPTRREELLSRSPHYGLVFATSCRAQQPIVSLRAALVRY